MKCAKLSLSIFFDLDGTLTDPREGITKSIEYSLDKLNHRLPHPAPLETYIGPPLSQTFAQILKTEDQTLIEKAIGFYRERYSKVGMFENTVYPKIAEALSVLLAHEHRLFVLTAKPDVYAEKIIAYFALDRFFCRIYGATLDGRFQHKPDLFAHALTEECISASKAIVVGDRHHDIAAGLENKATTIGVTYGYGSKAELMEAKADYLAEKPESIPRIVDHIGTLKTVALPFS